MNKKHRILNRISALLLVTVLLVFSLTGCFSKKNLSNDVLITKDSVVTKLAEDRSLPAFDTTAFANVELCFNVYYYTDLPDNDTLVSGTKAAFEEFCKDVDKSDIDAVTHALIDCYIYAIGDRYSYYRTPSELEDYNADMGGSFVGIGVSVIRNDLENSIQVVSAEPDSPAERAGIQPNDYIVAVDGVRVEDIGTQALVNKIKGEIGTTVSVTLKRGDEEITLEMIRALITETFVTYEFIENTKIVYIKIKTFKGDNENNTLIQFREAISFAESNGAEGVIFDLCGNPGGYLHLVADMLSYLVPNDTLIASFSNNRSSIYADNDGTGSNPFDHVLTLPSVVIVNGNSASASELFTGALRDYNDMGILKSTVVGHNTFKKGIMQSTIAFNDGSALTLTTALYNPPSGTNFHGVGVQPDVFVENEEDFMRVAIEELNKLINN